MCSGNCERRAKAGASSLAEAFAGRDQRELRLIDPGCGTGRFLDFVKQAWPRLPVLGLDLSQAYILHARPPSALVARQSYGRQRGGIPAQKNSCAAVISIFLLHELPSEVRRTVVSEAARVLKPGGRSMLVDLLRGDELAYDAMLQRSRNFIISHIIIAT